MNKYEIEDVLPHQKPMILIDTLLKYDEDSCCCQVTITSNSPFYCAEKKGVPSYIGSEYMAQTIAAYAGAQALDKNNSVSIGFLLGTRKYKTACSHFSIDKTLDISIKELYQEDSGLRVFECEITDVDNAKLSLVQANINVFQPKDPQAFLSESYPA